MGKPVSAVKGGKTLTSWMDGNQLTCPTRNRSTRARMRTGGAMRLWEKGDADHAHPTEESSSGERRHDADGRRRWRQAAATAIRQGRAARRR